MNILELTRASIEVLFRIVGLVSHQIDIRCTLLLGRALFTAMLEIARSAMLTAV